MATVARPSPTVATAIAKASVGSCTGPARAMPPWRREAGSRSPGSSCGSGRGGGRVRIGGEGEDERLGFVFCSVRFDRVGLLRWRWAGGRGCVGVWVGGFFLFDFGLETGELGGGECDVRHSWDNGCGGWGFGTSKHGVDDGE